MKTIIYTHPSAGSFNHEILNRLTNYFSKYDEDFQLIDFDEYSVFGYYRVLDYIIKL